MIVYFFIVSESSALLVYLKKKTDKV